MRIWQVSTRLPPSKSRAAACFPASPRRPAFRRPHSNAALSARRTRRLGRLFEPRARSCAHPPPTRDASGLLGLRQSEGLAHETLKFDDMRCVVAPAMGAAEPEL